MRFGFRAKAAAALIATVALVGMTSGCANKLSAEEQAAVQRVEAAASKAEAAANRAEAAAKSAADAASRADSAASKAEAIFAKGMYKK